MQSLSKSKLPLKITKIFMVFVLFFSLIIQKPKETHAFPLALLLPAITNPATVTALLGVVGLGAAGVATGDWYEQNYERLEQTTIETVGLMSEDMKKHFETSLDNLINGFSNGLELSKDFLTDFINKFTDTYNNTGQIISSNLYDRQHEPGRLLTFTLKDGLRIKLTHATNGNVRYENTVSFQHNYRTQIGSVIIALSTSASVFDNFTLEQAMQYIFANKYSDYHIQLVYNDQAINLGTPAGPDMQLDNVGDYLTEQVLNNVNKLGLNVGINELVNLRTNQGVPLYVDNLGQVVLRDGRPFEGDLSDIIVSNRVPAVTDVAGTLSPTITNDFGMINIRTGENVIPNPNPPTPNLPPKIKPETTKPTTGIQRFLPVAVVIVFILFLKAIVFYAIRLFDFILTLPLTPSKPIDNYAFQWFMDAKILGIQVYDTVLAFAMFAFSLTIYKVIRRIW